MSMQPPKRGDIKYARPSKRRDSKRIMLPSKHLFITEGTKTEPYYLYGLINILSSKLGTGIKTQLIVKPESTNTLFLLERAEAYLQNETSHFQHVWVIYDKDDFPPDRFDNTVQRCEALTRRGAGVGPHFHAIWSNQCFELWFLLHFVPLVADIPRADYCKKLSDHLKENGLCDKYEKNDPNIFQHLYPKLDIALGNARRLRRRYAGSTYSTMSPCTTAYEILEEFYSYLK